MDANGAAQAGAAAPAFDLGPLGAGAIVSFNPRALDLGRSSAITARGGLEWASRQLLGDAGKKMGTGSVSSVDGETGGATCCVSTAGSSTRRRSTPSTLTFRSWFGRTTQRALTPTLDTVCSTRQAVRVGHRRR